MKSLESRLTYLENKQNTLDRNGGFDVEKWAREFEESKRNGTVAGSEFVTRD